jgi:hypothetical protein
MKALEAMNEQMFCLVKNQDPNLKQLSHESGMHSSKKWCTTCRQANHKTQLCTTIIQPQVPNCRPPHQGNQHMNPP